MRILLPPSETKRNGEHAPALALAALTAPALEPQRDQVVRALIACCATPTPRVRAAIGITARQDAELSRNVALLHAPTSPAHDIYTGVLFDALAFHTRTPSVRRRLAERVIVQSALFGVVGFDDAIPAYRLSAGSTLPNIGGMAAFWRAHLPDTMDALLAEHLVVDMRSGVYASMWQAPAEQAGNVVVIKVMQVRGGRRLAVSHANKATKGHLAAALCATEAQPRTPKALAGLLERRGFDVRLIGASGQPWTLEVLAD